MTNKFLIFITLLLAGCGGNQSIKENHNAISTPSDIESSFMSSTSLYGSDDGGPSANIAVLLPMNGPAKKIGNDIKTSIETAFLRRPKSNIKISFFDVSGDLNSRKETIIGALDSKPDVVIGPLFAEDTMIVRDLKDASTPVISFTSDINALGNNVATINLIPTQSIEAIVNQMQSDNATKIVIIAPNDESGKMMAGVADKTAKLYNIPVVGLFYYDSGNSDSIKDASLRTSMYNTRTAVNTRAREILSDILTKEDLTSQTKASLNTQLERISRKDTLGKLPYDAILVLGNGEDTKTLVSFLRYHGIGTQDAKLYGTTLWHNSDIASDFTLSGAKYATLPEISDNFVNLYNMVSGENPDYLSAFGYDATNLALGLIYTQKSKNAYLFDPSGYVGTTGIFRIQPSGESERGLQIMELNGSGTTNITKNAPENFLVSIYNINAKDIKPLPEHELSTRGINPGDYITIPENLRTKPEYRTKTIGANYIPDETGHISQPIQIFATQETETISNPEFEPVKLETVSRKNIDSVEIAE